MKAHSKKRLTSSLPTGSLLPVTFLTLMSLALTLMALIIPLEKCGAAHALPPRKIFISDPGDNCPHYLRRLKAQADELYQEEEFDKAIEIYTNLLRKEPNCIAFLVKRSESYAMNKKMELAVKDMTRVVQLRPNRDYGFLSRGRLYENMGKEDLAMKDYQTAVTLGSATGYKDQAHIFERRGEYKIAADYMGRYIRSSRPLSAIPFYFDRARIYDKMGRKDLAAQDRKTANDLVNSSGGHQIDKYRR